MDKPSGLLGTGPAGQLIVHPRSSFTLHCLYPRNNWGYPSWNVTYSKSDALRKHLIPRNGINKVSLTIIAAKEEDGGLYKCITPFGKAHGISVLVQGNSFLLFLKCIHYLYCKKTADFSLEFIYQTKISITLPYSMVNLNIKLLLSYVKKFIQLQKPICFL